MPSSIRFGTNWDYIKSALVDRALGSDEKNSALFYLARVIESGEDAINNFQQQLGFRPPDGTVRAKIPTLHYTQKEEECPLFYPLFPPELIMTPVVGQVIIVTFPFMGAKGDIFGNGYWLREAIREIPVEITEEEGAASTRFDFETIGNQETQFGSELTEDTKDSGKYENDELEYTDSNEQG